ncbi:ABC transporter permease [Pseudomonas sp. SDO528_S397]
MKRIPVVFRRQFTCFLSAPATYLSGACFLALSTAAGWQASALLAPGSRDLQAFFQFHPWFYLLLVPVLCTQLWSDEYKDGSLDFLRTLPLTSSELVIGKFLAAWAVLTLILLLTFPLVIATHYLGTPDNSVIASQYLASALLAGSYLAVGCFICTFTHKRLVIFIVTLCLLLAASGVSSVLDALDHQAPIWVMDSFIALSPSMRFDAIDNGLLTLPDGLYFVSLIGAFLTMTTVTLNYKNA